MLMFYISMLKICECFDKFQKLPPVDIVILNTCCAQLNTCSAYQHRCHHFYVELPRQHASTVLTD